MSLLAALWMFSCAGEAQTAAPTTAKGAPVAALVPTATPTFWMVATVAKKPPGYEFLAQNAEWPPILRPSLPRNALICEVSPQLPVAGVLALQNAAAARDGAALEGMCRRYDLPVGTSVSSRTGSSRTDSRTRGSLLLLNFSFSGASQRPVARLKLYRFDGARGTKITDLVGVEVTTPLPAPLAATDLARMNVSERRGAQNLWQQGVRRQLEAAVKQAAPRLLSGWAAQVSPLAMQNIASTPIEMREFAAWPSARAALQSALEADLTRVQAARLPVEPQFNAVVAGRWLVVGHLFRAFEPAENAGKAFVSVSVIISDINTLHQFLGDGKSSVAPPDLAAPGQTKESAASQQALQTALEQAWTQALAKAEIAPAPSVP